MILNNIEILKEMNILNENDHQIEKLKVLN